MRSTGSLLSEIMEWGHLHNYFPSPFLQSFLQQGVYKSFLACCAIVRHTPAPANSCGCKQEKHVNKSFNSIWFHDVTSAALWIAKLHCTSPNGASACYCPRIGDAMFEICCPAFVLVPWVWVWSDSFLLAPLWVSVCVTEMWLWHSTQCYACVYSSSYTRKHPLHNTWELLPP